PAQTRTAPGIRRAPTRFPPARSPGRPTQASPWRGTAAGGGALMDLGLNGRTALICASTQGLGEATARALAAEGANVIVCGRSGERAREIAAELPNAEGVAADLLAADGPERLVAAAKAFGAIDILVLNGPGPEPGAAADITSQDVT